MSVGFRNGLGRLGCLQNDVGPRRLVRICMFQVFRKRVKVRVRRVLVPLHM